MGIAIPQVITNRSGAQIIDGSLKFDQGKTQHLTRTPSSDGNKRTWTWSGWVKPAAGALGDASGSALFAAYSAGNDRDVLRFGGSSTDAVDFQHRRGGSNYGGYTDAKLRDYGGTGWYHVVLVWNDAATIYVNGVEQSLSGVSNDANNGQINNNVIHYIGARSSSGSAELGWDGQMSQIYFIDGQALEPTEFGFTDPLTNTWKPKKFSGNFTQSSVNDGTTWSSSISGPVDSTYPLSNAFGGTIGSSYTSGTRPTVGNTLTFDISSKNLTVAKVRLNTFLSVAGNGATLQVNDTDVTTNLANGDQTHEITINGQFNNVKWSYDSTNGPYVYMRGIEVDLGTGRGYELLTDGLTDTGANSFYLPMDGNSPIGEDQSGNGNDWTPVNFGGSVALDNPQVSGAKPILNTTQGGTAAGVGVFGSKQNVGYAVTVYNDGGGNKYYIDGVKQDTVTGLIRGATYTFDTSDSTVSSHPFRFSATSNGSHGGGSEYTNGVAAITGAATTITVPHDAPNTLYYYCTSHSGMGADITGITTNEKLADQYASNCTLALPLVGDDDDICASIACTARNKTATNSSVNPSNAVDKPHSNFYNGSHHWSAASDTLQYAEQGDELVFGQGDFTIECWVYDDNGHNGGGSGRCYIFDNRIGGSVVGDPPTMIGHCDSHNEFTFYDGDSEITHSVSSTVGKWWHYAVTREGTTTRMFIDGILRGSSTSSTNFTNNGIGVGRATDGGYGWAGYIQDFRVYKGIAKYTSDFVIPATSPDILPDTPSGVSGGSKLAKITDGSVAFDGTNDSVSIADHADFTFGSGDFTLEAYAYLDYATGYRSLAQKYGGSPSSSSWFWSFNDGQQVFYYYSGGNEPNMTSPIKQYNRWVHCAVAREGNTIRMFDDGKLTGTLDVSSYTSMNDSTVPVDIGADYADNYDFNGFISNVRIVKGTALYTKNFTPPTAPLTNVTNTKLLCCQSPTSATEAAVSPSTPSVVNDATATNFNPFNTDINTVRGQESGYCTWNPLIIGPRNSGTQSSATFSEGNLKLVLTGSGDDVAGTITVDSGKWYYEIRLDTAANHGAGWTLFDDFNNSTTYSGSTGGIVNGDGHYGTAESSSNSIIVQRGTTSAATNQFNDGSTIGYAFDIDAGTMKIYVDGIFETTISSIPSGTYVPIFGDDSSTDAAGTANFGQKPFKFSPPDGFQPLNTANTRPVKVISRSDQYVGVTTYSGNSTAGHRINVGFDPDLVIFGRRGNNAERWTYDTLRGAGYALKTGSDGQQENQTGSLNFLKAFVDDGFTLGTDQDVNSSSDTYVTWSWRAGGSKGTFNKDDVGYASAAAAGLTGGDITPTGSSVGTKQGFSIIKFTGSGSGTPSIPHGLSEAPTCIIQKDTGANTSWRVFMYIGSTWKIFNLNNNDVASNATETAPTSSLFYANGNGNAANTQIAYLWHDVPGLQKFGTYESGGSTYDGPYIELGFKPAIVIVKAATRTYGSHWSLIDSKRNPSNFSSSGSGTKILYISSQGGAEFTSGGAQLDILSSGFKARNNSSDINDGGTYIYMAWAEAPSIDLFGGGANAR